MTESTWLKAHAMVGTTTNIVTADQRDRFERRRFARLPALVASTAQRFQMAEVSADKAYLGHANLAAIEAVGAVPYVPFKTNSRTRARPRGAACGRMFLYRQDEFLAHYHKRSNVESTFSAIKRKFGGAVRSKRFTAQVNEVLCKILCHNLSVPRSRDARAWDRAHFRGGGGVRSESFKTDLTPEEQRNVRTALRYLHTNSRRWKVLGRAIKVQPDTIFRIVSGRRSSPAAMAFRVARLANVSIDNLLAGKTVPAGTCPHCGRVP